jgi:NAD(P)-dependent dehydrogenase (short-subunit alcohol dehydrogenase family)
MVLDGMSTLDLTGRVALVPAASRGIEHAIAAALPTRGAAVTITGERVRVDGGLLATGPLR